MPTWPTSRSGAAHCAELMEPECHLGLPVLSDQQVVAGHVEVQYVALMHQTQGRRRLLRHLQARCPYVPQIVAG